MHRALPGWSSGCMPVSPVARTEGLAGWHPCHREDYPAGYSAGRSRSHEGSTRLMPRRGLGRCSTSLRAPNRCLSTGIGLSSTTDGNASGRAHPASIDGDAGAAPVMETQMRFLFTTIPGSGHFHPMVPTARALRRRGHDIAFAASPTFATTIEAAGFEAFAAGPAWLESLSDPVMQKILAGEFFVDLIRMGMVEGVIRGAKASGADAIVRGSGELCGLVAAAILDLPVASASPGGAKFFEAMIRPGVARAAAEHGLDGERVTADDFEILQDRSHASLAGSARLRAASGQPTKGSWSKCHIHRALSPLRAKRAKEHSRHDATTT